MTKTLKRKCSGTCGQLIDNVKYRTMCLSCYLASDKCKQEKERKRKEILITKDDPVFKLLSDF